MTFLSKQWEYSSSFSNILHCSPQSLWEACRWQHLRSRVPSRYTNWGTSCIPNETACDWPASDLNFLSLESLTWQSYQFCCAITYKCAVRLRGEYLDRDVDVFVLLKITAQTLCEVSRQVVPTFYRRGRRCGLIKWLQANSWILSSAQLLFPVLKGNTGSSMVLSMPDIQKLLNCCHRAEILLPLRTSHMSCPLFFPCGGQWEYHCSSCSSLW